MKVSVLDEGDLVELLDELAALDLQRGYSPDGGALEVFLDLGEGLDDVVIKLGRFDRRDLKGFQLPPAPIILLNLRQLEHPEVDRSHLAMPVCSRAVELAASDWWKLPK